MKAYPVLLSLLLLSACSSTHEVVPEKIGVKRVELEQESYTRPQLYVKNFHFKSDVSRSPASTNYVEEQGNLSNRQLYFLTYYSQYLSLGKILGKETKLNICPSFHDVLLTYEDRLQPIKRKLASIEHMKKVKDQKELVVNYPVLAIPYSTEEDLFSRLENQRWDQTDKTLRAALEHYYEIEKTEVQTLCDRGVSPGYYIFENLVTYFKNDSSFHRTQAGLQALLKVPVLSNIIILDSLINNSTVAGSSSIAFDSALMRRSNLEWFSEYREHLRKRRVQQNITVKNEKVLK